jgi:hypothetical protein
MMSRLLELSKTSHITIVYYDINGSVFRRMIQEGRIKQEYQGLLSLKRDELRQKLKQAGDNNFYMKADSIICEQYLAISRSDDKDAFEKKVKSYLKPLYDKEKDKDSLYFRIDEAKRRAIDKPIQKITFQDYLKMYRGMSQELINVFEQHNIELIGINEYLVMSCWLNDENAIFAFPSKYNTDEIGFITQDRVFSVYINTMLEGVRNQLNISSINEMNNSKRTELQIAEMEKSLIKDKDAVLLPPSKFDNYDLSEALQIQYTGTINASKMNVTFEKVSKIFANEYHITGFTQAGSNICDFKGTINIEHYFKLDDDEHGVLTATFNLKENENQKSSGYFYGMLISNWTVSDRVLQTDSTKFIGDWTSYTTNAKKSVQW